MPEPLSAYQESYRPQFHFSPPQAWMNDPNGMIYDQGLYHLFYQHFPDDIVWGPMHWGHAVSKDLIHWEHRPIALHPDEKGYIFSGCAVADVNNSSGLGREGNYPLLALFTYHDEQAKQNGAESFQSQALAFSLDQGESWEKFKGNPVLEEESLIDFRDPKVFWHEELDTWIMIIACGDHIRIYHSPDLIKWEYISSFGADQGCHEGVWECPDLFELTVAGSDVSKWVMLVSLVKGGPNGGSATQYFLGDFDGYSFRNENPKEEIRWLDFGTDNYAGVSWANAPSTAGEKVFIAWMNNWDYATQIPTQKWRGAMTLPRELFLCEAEGEMLLGMRAIATVSTLRKREIKFEKKEPGASRLFYHARLHESPLVELNLAGNEVPISKLEVKFINESGECLLLQMDMTQNHLLLNRGGLNNSALGELFNPMLKAPLAKALSGESIRIFLDTSSLEIFACGGVVNLSAQIFPTQPFKTVEVSIEGGKREEIELSLYQLASIWKTKA